MAPDQDPQLLQTKSLTDLNLLKQKFQRDLVNFGSKYGCQADVLKYLITESVEILDDPIVNTKLRTDFESRKLKMRHDRTNSSSGSSNLILMKSIENKSLHYEIDRPPMTPKSANRKGNHLKMTKKSKKMLTSTPN